MAIVKVDGPVGLEGPIPRSVKPNPKWGEFFSGDSGFAVNIAQKIKAFVFYDKRIDGPEGARKALLAGKKITLAYVVGRHQPAIDWIVEAEPIGPSQLGLVIYNADRKAMYAGTGDYDNNKFTAELKTLYANVTNLCKQKATVKISHTSDDGHTTVTGEASVEYET